MKTTLNILTLPFWLIYSLIMKPIAFRMFNKYFQQKENKIQDLYKEIRKLQQKNDDFKKEFEQEKRKIERIKNFIKYWENSKKEVFVSRQNELIFIFSEKDKIFSNWVYLCGENGKHHSNDSRIALISYGDKLKITDFISNTKRQGYGRILLEYVINFAQQNGIKKIIGDLSTVDEYEFEWLIPFYKSVGFEKKPPNENSKEIMAGEIFMDLLVLKNKNTLMIEK